MDGDFLLEMGEKSFGLRGGDLSPLYSLMLKTLRATPLTDSPQLRCAPPFPWRPIRSFAPVPPDGPRYLISLAMLYVNFDALHVYIKPPTDKRWLVSGFCHCAPRCVFCFAVHPSFSSAARVMYSKHPSLSGAQSAKVSHDTEHAGHPRPRHTATAFA